MGSVGVSAPFGEIVAVQVSTPCPTLSTCTEVRHWCIIIEPNISVSPFSARSLGVTLSFGSVKSAGRLGILWSAV